MGVGEKRKWKKLTLLCRRLMIVHFQAVHLIHRKHSYLTISFYINLEGLVLLKQMGFGLNVHLPFQNH